MADLQDINREGRILRNQRATFVLLSRDKRQVFGANGKAIKKPDGEIKQTCYIVEQWFFSPPFHLMTPLDKHFLSSFIKSARGHYVAQQVGGNKNFQGTIPHVQILTCKETNTRSGLLFDWHKFCKEHEFQYGGITNVETLIEYLSKEWKWLPIWHDDVDVEKDYDDLRKMSLNNLLCPITRIHDDHSF